MAVRKSIFFLLTSAGFLGLGWTLDATANILETNYKLNLVAGITFIFGGTITHSIRHHGWEGERGG